MAVAAGPAPLHTVVNSMKELCTERAVLSTLRPCLVELRLLMRAVCLSFL